MDEKYRLQDRDWKEEEEIRLKQYFRLKGISNPDLELTEQDMKKAQALIRALRENPDD